MIYNVISGKNAEAQLMVGDPDVNINVLDEVSGFSRLTGCLVLSFSQGCQIFCK